MAGWRAALLVLGMAATAAAANSTADPFASSDQIRLCGCSDLLWTPQPSAAAEVINWHNKLVQEVTAREADGGYDVLFYGDSITMRWRSDWPRNRWGGPPPANSSGGTPMGVFNATFRVNYTSDVMGIGSDTTANLLWRVQNGELPIAAPPKAVVILIGTNDLGYTEACFMSEADNTAAALGTSARLRHVVAYMRQQMPSTQILILGILPRGSWTLDNPVQWPNRLTNAITAVNNASQALAAEDPMISYLYCGAPFVPASGNLSHALLPDALHPSTAGYRLLAACIAPVLGPLVHRLPPVNSSSVLQDTPHTDEATCDGYTGVYTSAMAAYVDSLPLQDAPYR